MAIVRIEWDKTPNKDLLKGKRVRNVERREWQKQYRKQKLNRIKPR